MTVDNPTLFDTPPVVARGPVQSQLTVDSLGRDTTLKHGIAVAVTVCSARMTGHHADYDRPVTDDDIVDYLERTRQRRFQRNVIARTRGLMERAGWFVAVPDVTGRTGRPTHAVIPDRSCLVALGIVR